jgi:putative transposase
MRQSRFSEEQIIGVVKEHQAGLAVAEICRRHGISDAKFYAWRSKYGGLEVSDAKRLKALEEENRSSRSCLPSRCWTRRCCARCSEKTSNAQLPKEGRDLGHPAWAIQQKHYFRRRACALVGLAPKSYRHRSRRPDDARLRERLRKLAPERRRFGYRRLLILLRREGIVVNHKRGFRLYRKDRLSVRRRRGRKRAVGTRAPMTIPQGPNQRWSLDFAADVLSDGRRFRVLVVVETSAGSV